MWIEKSNIYETLENRTETLEEKISKIEAKLWIINSNEKLSDDVLKSSYKMLNLLKQNQANNTDLSQYETLISKIEKSANIDFNSKCEFYQVTINWSMYETVWNLYEWSKKAFENIKTETIDWLKTILNPEELAQVAKWLFEALKNPTQLINWIIECSKTEFKEIYNHIEIVRQSSTPSGFSTNMSEYIPETAIPMIIWLVWPWKFLKILKLDKFIPESIMKKIEKLSWESEEKPKSNYEENKHNALEFKMSFENVKIADLSYEMNKIWKQLDISYFKQWPEIVNIVMQNLENMSDYIIKNAYKIRWNPQYRKDVLLELWIIRRELTKIKQNVNNDLYENIINDVIEINLKESHNIIF